jgi:hypothetical protein
LDGHVETGASFAFISNSHGWRVFSLNPLPEGLELISGAQPRALDRPVDCEGPDEHRMPRRECRTVKDGLIKLVQRIGGEFDEAAGLRVSIGEAARFFGLDVETCEQVLTTLFQAGFLAKDDDGRYRRL